MPAQQVESLLISARSQAGFRAEEPYVVVDLCGAGGIIRESGQGCGEIATVDMSHAPSQSVERRQQGRRILPDQRIKPGGKARLYVARCSERMDDCQGKDYSQDDGQPARARGA